MSKIESEVRDHALALLHEDYNLVEKKIEKIPEKLMSELNSISQLVREIPDNIEKSLAKIACALDDAEKTAVSLSDEARIAIKAIGDSEIDAIRREVLAGVTADLNKTQELSHNIRRTLNSYPNAFRPKAPLGPLLALAALIMAAILGNGYFTWKMYQESDENHWTMLQINRIYQKQLNIIDSLPPDIRKKFFDRQDVHARKRP